MPIHGKGLKRARLGDLLVSLGVLTEEQLVTALEVQKKQGSKLGEVLIQLNMIDEVKLAHILSQQMHLTFVDLKHVHINPDVVQKIPERISRRFRIIAIDQIEETYTVGMADPTDLVAYDEVIKLFGKSFNMVVVTETDMLRIIDQVYRRTEDIVSFAEELKEELGKDQAALELAEAEAVSETAPVARLLDSIFEDAVQVGASDIHIEPDEKFLRIRQRIDGVLNESIIQGTEVTAALVLRIKLMAHLNISEKRLPQDGRFFKTVKDHHIDIRVSTMPVRFGESVVMRLLDQSSGILRMSELGMPPKILERMKYLIHRPLGMVLVTGPTGSGKTTTLYSALAELNTKETKIITIEDPIEYTMSRINQIQVNPIIGLDFSTILRSTIRQDPDIIMVGEIRDEETVRIALRAAMTGHLVFSTLHTNDSISCAMRLMDMGAEGFLIASALKAVLAQRLVRKICPVCIKDYTPNNEERDWLRNLLGSKFDEKATFKKGAGCARCNQTGYRGRLGVYELLEIELSLADALRVHDSKLFTHLAQQQTNFQPLTIAAYNYALQGTTSLEEVLSLAIEVEQTEPIFKSAQEQP